MLHLDNKLIWGVTEQDMLLIAGYYIELTNLTENNLLSFSDISLTKVPIILIVVLTQDFSSVSVSQSIL